MPDLLIRIWTRGLASGSELHAEPIQECIQAIDFLLECYTELSTNVAATASGCSCSHLAAASRWCDCQCTLSLSLHKSYFWSYPCMLFLSPLHCAEECS